MLFMHLQHLKGAVALRVISGKLRGLKLDSPCGMDTRPTLDRVKEAVFNIIFSRVYDAAVLDLFAGSGALGIEALSRGAAWSTFADNNANAVSTIKSNLRKARFDDNYEVIFGDSIDFLKKTDKKYDIIFLDPPYKAGLYEEILNIIKQRSILNGGGIVVLECDSANSAEVGDFCVLKDKTYGKARIYVLEDAADNEENSSISRQL